MRAIIAAAGTGGHINPGLAIANKIMEEDKDSEVIFIGTDDGLEVDLVPRSGYELKTVDACGIERSFELENFRRLKRNFKSMKISRQIIRDFKPDVVIGTGGYITWVVGKAAIKEKIPFFMHESNAYPGAAVKLLQKKANKVFVGFEEAKDRLPKAKEVVVTGTPAKVQNLNLSQDEKNRIRKEIGFNNDLPIVLAFGGSQGAKSINESLKDIIKSRANDNYNLMWATGKEGYEIIKSELDKQGVNVDNIETVKLVPYIYNMDELMNAVDLVVARSGAMTITEISNVGVPAIFIPFPYATENHQEFNARVLSDKGAAKLILDKNLTAEILHENIEEIIDNPQLREEMCKIARSISKKNVLEKIYNEINHR